MDGTAQAKGRAMSQRDKRERARRNATERVQAIRHALQRLGMGLHAAVCYGAGYCDRCGRKASARCRETCWDPEDGE